MEDIKRDKSFAELESLDLKELRNYSLLVVNNNNRTPIRIPLTTFINRFVATSINIKDPGYNEDPNLTKATCICTTHENLPDKERYFVLTFREDGFSGEDNTGRQMAIPLYKGTIYTRRKYDGIWAEWQELIKSV